jgi:hypothetical protein
MVPPDELPARFMPGTICMVAPEYAKGLTCQAIPVILGLEMVTVALVDELKLVIGLA